MVTPFMKKGIGNINGIFKSNHFIGCNYTCQFLKESFFYNKAFSGGAIVFCKIKNFDNPITYGLNEYIPMSHFRGPLPKICGENVENIGVFHNITEVSPSGASDLWKKICNRRIEGTSNIISTKIGKGRVVTYSSHPEKYYAVDKYTNYSTPVRLVYNSVFYVASKGPLVTNIDKNISFSNLELETDGPSSGNVSDLIEFQCSVNNGSSPYTYFWDFGDGTTSIISNPSYQYLKPNEYLVTLTVIDNNSNIDTSFFEINISGEPAVENRPPEKPVEFYGNKRIGKIGGLLYFRMKTEDPDGDLFWYKIEQDDEIDNEHYTKYRYVESNQSLEFFKYWEETGTYILRIKAVDIYGAESEWSEPIEVIITKHPFITRIFKTNLFSFHSSR